MYVRHLSLADFRSYASAEVALTAGVCTFLGANGQGKTNLVEAIGYLATLSSHRVATDAPLVRDGAASAVARAAVVRDERQLLLEVEIVPGKTNRARINKVPAPRPRELVGLLQVVVFAPEDLALVRGDPAERRRFLDDLAVLRAPRLAGVRADYDRVLRQRNTLLKTAGQLRGSARREADLSTLDVWDEHLARTGGELLAARLDLLETLRSPVEQAYAAVATGVEVAGLDYQAALGAALDGAGRPPGEDDGAPDQAAPPGAAILAGATRDELTGLLLAGLAASRGTDLDRGVTTVGPHRDELVLRIGGLPVRGYASHGESWSMALALRLAAYDVLRADGQDPVLVLDDVFAELDTGRRERLAALVAGAEQVLVTAAVPGDVPAELRGARYTVAEGLVARAG